MSNPIPPLVCDSPPPIDDDFEPSDDDFGAFEGAEESMSPREEKSSSVEAKFELPVPEIHSVAEACDVETLPQREDPLGEAEEHQEQEVKEDVEKSAPAEQDLRLGDDVVVKRCESPPSLVLSEDFSRFPDEPPADSNSSDEVSLPSLHLDSGGESKSVTPTFAPVPDNTDAFVIAEDDKVGHDAEESFGDFAEFTSAAAPVSAISSSEPEKSAAETIDFVADFSQFDASASAVVSANQSRDNQLEDDDEFGDFSDFQQEAATTAVIDTTNLNSQFLSALDLLFPKAPESADEEARGVKIDDETAKSQILEDLRDFEASKAIQYQWLNSSSNQCLIRSLGIDSRNILYGGKWNSSMPRFAANLGFSPLQPMKPGAGASSAFSMSQTRSDAASAGVTEVPAAQFDWTSAGLVNPLDGAPKVLPKPDDSEDPQDQSESVAAAAPAAAAEPGDVVVAKEVSAAGVRPTPQAAFSQPLRETHIFTPSKSSNPVARDVVSELGESKVVVKEYRDVEYNPDKVAAAAAATTRLDDDFSDFTEFKGAEVVKQEVAQEVIQRNPPTESPYRAPQSAVAFTKPTFGVSPTEEIVNGGMASPEDDFSDFQSVTPPHSAAGSQMAPVLQPLSVAKLTEGSPKIAWPSPGINPDEMARLEAIFPQKRPEKVEMKVAAKGRDEDEWSDFVSGNISTSNRDDDWTDFMSGGAPAQKALQQGPNFSSWTTPQLPPPQFTAWHHSNIFNPPQFGGQATDKVMNNGQINGFPLVNPSLATITSGNQRYPAGRRVARDPQSISVIPDMSFRAPKSLINLPRSGFAKK
ncbi:aftiphilin isoform X2 [Phlebotomus argentipes]|uniref:aftiphilin isoform X2 n=1 Tax=Phlebotomus argentipes TaxID=94469 RepID=UPI00289333BE|nr:aftiphilin isoform X2 [Phlebotomus argentipes]